MPLLAVLTTTGTALNAELLAVRLLLSELRAAGVDMPVKAWQSAALHASPTRRCLRMLAALALARDVQQAVCAGTEHETEPICVLGLHVACYGERSRGGESNATS